MLNLGNESAKLGAIKAGSVVAECEKVLLNASAHRHVIKMRIKVCRMENGPRRQHCRGIRCVMDGLTPEP